jgi:hypothetical protein
VATELAWPELDDVAGWGTLADAAFQLETLKADLEESQAWERTMRELVKRQLTYEAFTEARHEALSARMRRRKLDQANLRYRFGFRQGRRPRRPRLVRDAVKETLGPIFAK